MSASQKKVSPRSNTRRQLLLAAEKLFAESGIDAVSLRQINVAAGQKNSSAAHYHFGSKDALILSIYKSRMASVNERRLSALDEIEAQGKSTDVRCLVTALVHPIVAEIDADDSGGNYIRFMAHAIGHPQLDLLKLWRQEHNEGLVRLIQLIREALPGVPDSLISQRFGLTWEQIVHSLADRERLRRSAKSDFKVNSALFVNNLIDVVAGAMSADVSEETHAELERSKART